MGDTKKRATSSKNTRNRGAEKRGKEKKERKVYRQELYMTGEVTRIDTFGKDDEHISFTVKDDISGLKYVFKMFNVSDELYDEIADSERVRVGFNLSYNTYNDNLQLQLVAWGCEALDTEFLEDDGEELPFN